MVEEKSQWRADEEKFTTNNTGGEQYANYVHLSDLVSMNVRMDLSAGLLVISTDDWVAIAFCSLFLCAEKLTYFLLLFLLRFFAFHKLNIIISLYFTLLCCDLLRPAVNCLVSAA